MEKIGNPHLHHCADNSDVFRQILKEEFNILGNALICFPSIKDQDQSVC